MTTVDSLAAQRPCGVLKLPVQVLARVLKGSAGHLAEPECPHEFKTWQLARLVPFLQGRVHIEFRILDDFVAEAVNDHGDGVDAPDPFVKTLLCHWKSLLKIDYSSLYFYTIFLT